MIRKAIVESAASPTSYRIRIPEIDAARGYVFSTQESELPIAYVCAPPNAVPNYIPNDIVYIAYEKGEDPVIIGKLLTEKEDCTYQDISLNNLSVQGEIEVGDTTRKDIENLSNTDGNIQSQINDLSSMVDALSKNAGSGGGGGGGGITSVTLIKGSGKNVLGTDTSFTTSPSNVTFSGGSSESFVKSYPGVSGTASKVTAGTAVSVAKEDSSATPVSYVGNGLVTSLLSGATVVNGVLKLSASSVSHGSVTGTNGSVSITPYSAEDVSVLTGLGTPTTGSAVTSVGSATAGAQSIVVGENDEVKVAEYNALGVTYS